MPSDENALNEARYDIPAKLDVLVVDDSEADAVLFRQLVKGVGIQDTNIIHCSGFDDGLEYLKARSFDVAFIDHNLGSHTGTELIIAAGGRNCPTPLVLLTGQFGWEVERGGIEAGAVDFVDKNLLSPQLLRRVIGFAQSNHGTARELVHNLESYRGLAEAAAHANTQKSQFFAEMSHELRTPLNAIIGFAEVMKEQHFGPIEGPAAARYSSYADDIYVSSQHLLGLVNNLLDLSKFEAGAYQIAAESVGIESVLDDIVRMTTVQANAGGLELNLHYDRDIPELVFDRRLILQALLNVVTNAINFTEKGGRIDIFAKIEDSCLALIVRDTGCGIPPSEIESVLLPYRQGTALKTRPGGGTGLGLTLTKSIAELHNGTVLIESELGTGTEVTILLPGAVQETQPLVH